MCQKKGTRPAPFKKRKGKKAQSRHTWRGGGRIDWVPRGCRGAAVCQGPEIPFVRRTARAQVYTWKLRKMPNINIKKLLNRDKREHGRRWRARPPARLALRSSGVCARPSSGGGGRLALPSALLDVYLLCFCFIYFFSGVDSVSIRHVFYCAALLTKGRGAASGWMRMKGRRRRRAEKETTPGDGNADRRTTGAAITWGLGVYSRLTASLSLVLRMRCDTYR